MNSDPDIERAIHTDVKTLTKILGKFISKLWMRFRRFVRCPLNV